MPDPKAYTTRAALAGPFEFLEILNEGANHYTAAIVDIVNAAPNEDLPLIIATLHIAADACAPKPTRNTQTYFSISSSATSPSRRSPSESPRGRRETPMPKAHHDFITPETARRIKAMSFVDLGDYLWRIYLAGYGAGLQDGRRAARGAPPEEPTNNNE